MPDSLESPRPPWACWSVTPRPRFYVIAAITTVCTIFSFGMVFASEESAASLMLWNSIILLSYGVWTGSVKDSETASKTAKKAKALALEEAARAAAGKKPVTDCCFGLVSPKPRPRFYIAVWMSFLVLAGCFTRIGILVAQYGMTSPEIVVWSGPIIQVINSWITIPKDGKSKAPDAHEDENENEDDGEREAKPSMVLDDPVELNSDEIEAIEADAMDADAMDAEAMDAEAMEAIV